MDDTLYHHRIYCLHGEVGALVDEAGGMDTTLGVDLATLADSTIVVGAQIVLSDAGSTSATMTVTDIGMTSLSVMSGPGGVFPVGSVIARTPHWVDTWRTDDMDLMTCPEDASHMTQAGSAHIVDSRATSEVRIRQCSTEATHPELVILPIAAGSGTSTRVTSSRPTESILVGVTVWTENTHIGDTLSVMIAPKMAVGMLSMDAKLGDTVLNVSDAVLGAATVDRHVCLGSTEGLGRMLSIDMVAKTITVGVPLTAPHAAGTTVQISDVLMLDDRLPSFQTEIRIGFNSLNKRTLMPSTELIAVYTNAGSASASGEILLGVSVLAA